MLQTDRPGLIAAVCSVLAKAHINVSFMTVTRTGKGQDAIMAIGLDDKPDQVRVCACACLCMYMCVRASSYAWKLLALECQA